MDQDAGWARLDRFAALVAGDPDQVPLDRATLALATVLRSGTDVEGAITTLDELATALPERTFSGMRRHLFDDVGFRGDREHYDDPRNSFLDLVLARRRGLPILLATVVIEVGRRAGVPVVGIGMPMHFLVRDGEDGNAYVDPFTGDALDSSGVRRVFETIADGRLAWADEFLEPVNPRAMISRMLANLFAAYRRRHDRVRLALVARMRASVPELQAEAPVADRLGAVFN